MPDLDGIDVSYAQEHVDWAAVAKGESLRFAMARMSHGGRGNDDLRTDKQAVANRDGMRKSFVGHNRGFYHFLGKSDPDVQAKYFKSIVGELQQGEFVMLDVEPDKRAGIGTQSVDHIVATLKAIQQEFGVVPGVYIGGYYDGAADRRLDAFPLFLPAYTSVEEREKIEARLGRKATVWQWGVDKDMDGIVGAVDANTILDEVGWRSLQHGDTGTKPQPKRDDPATYVVKENDSWYRIASRELGSESRAIELAELNGTTIESVIHPGDVLKLPVVQTPDRPIDDATLTGADADAGDPAAPYSSKEFAVPGPSVGIMMQTPASAIFKDQLWVVGGWMQPPGSDDSHRPQLFQITADLVSTSHHGSSKSPVAVDSAIPALSNSTTNSSVWKVQEVKFSDNQPASSYGDRIGLVSLGDALYVFYHEFDGSIRAAKYTVDGDDGPGWTRLGVLADNDGNKLVDDAQGEISATSFGTKTLIVGCSNVTIDQKPSTFVGSFSTDDAGTTATWQATSGVTSGQGAGISLDWVNLALPDAPEPTAGGPPSTYVWVSTEDGHVPGRFVTQLLSVDEDGTLGSEPFFADTMPGDAHGPLTNGAGTVVRDPAGRVARYEATGAGTIRSTLANTYSTVIVPPSKPKQIGIPSIPQLLPVVSQSDLTAPNANAGMLTHRLTQPAVTFFFDSTSSVNTTLNGKNGTSTPIYEIICYGGDSTTTLWCQVNFYGSAESYAKYGSKLQLGYAKDYKGPKDLITIGGIIDGPVPVPNQNLADVVADPIGTVTYGNSKTSTSSLSVTNGWSAGIRSEGHTTKGAGPAWDISLSAGTSTTATKTASTSLSLPKSTPTRIDPSRPGHVLNEGNIFGTKTTFNWDAYRFLDASGNAIVDGTAGNATQQAPLLTRITADVSTGDTETFVPYAVTPGDLDSYLESSVNDRMESLGYGKNYVRDVLDHYGYPFGNNNYLTYSWASNGGLNASEFSALSSSFTESGRTIDASVYAGISGGFSIFGIEGMEASLMDGMTYSHQSTKDDLKEAGWSVALDKLDLPALGSTDSDPTKFVGYVFRVYFLPPPPEQPNKWVKELKDCLTKEQNPPENQFDPSKIDDGAHAWKIAFIVESMDHYTHE